MVRNPVRVCVRTRPTANFAQDQIYIDKDRNAIQIKQRDGSGHGSMHNKRDTWNFKYHQVMHNSGQDSMYDDVARHVVDGALDGVNGTVMAYGQTGAGKTFTMMGDARNFKQRGITPRALAHIFSEIEARPQIKFTVYVSYMELYLDRIYDLLDPRPPDQQDYSIVEDRVTRSMHVRGLSYERVESEEEALDVLFRGDNNKTVAVHQLNKNSNRSHCIFTVTIEQQSRVRAESVRKSKLHLVDLAGSERLKKAIEMEGVKADETLKRESRYINKSLTYLEQVVRALTSKQRSHVPYRQTKLTNVLKDSLGGNCNTVLITCVWSVAAHLEETISSLKLAQRMMRVENDASMNVHTDPDQLLKRYERKIRELKQELMMHDALSNRSGVSYDEYTPEQSREVAQMVREYIDTPEPDDEGVLKIVNVRQIRETFRQFKLMVVNAESEVEERLRKHFALNPKDGAKEGEKAAEEKESDQDEGVGEEDAEGGYSLGAAPANARPPELEGVPRGIGESPSRKSLASHSFSPHGADAKHDAVPENRSSAFTRFKETAGADTLRELAKARRAYRERKLAAGQLRQRLSQLRDAVQDLQATLDGKRSEQKEQESKDGADVVDEEEYQVIKDLHRAKKDFRSAHRELTGEKLALQTLSDDARRLERSLLDAFNVWHEESMAAAGGRVGGDADQLDDGEQFDRLEIERVMAEDPDSVAFFKAAKAQKERDRKRVGGRGRRRV